MEDFALILIFFIQAVCAFLITIAFIWRVRFLEQSRIIAKKYLSYIRKQDIPVFYSSYAVKKEAFRKVFHLHPKIENILYRTAIKDIQLGKKLIRHALSKEKYQNNTALLLLNAELFYLSGDYQYCFKGLSKINVKHFFSKYLKNQYLKLSALHELYQTDMLSASDYLSRALSYYQKKGERYEEAECYQLLSQIYRISGVFDVAFTMLKEAKKIYKELKIPAKLAEIEAYLGLTELGRENFRPAEEYFTCGLKICKKNNLVQTQANISNWLGLTLYQVKKYDRAELEFNFSFKTTSSILTKAFATEMLARIYYLKKDYKKALSFVKKSLTYATQAGLKAGIFENLYLEAEIYYQQQKFSLSRKILTALIKEKTSSFSTYYPANAYTLLGVIEYKENNFDLAKTLFRQALDLEHSRDRLKGAIIDCNNLAELAFRCQERNEAETYLHQALNYAKEINVPELIDYLTHKLELTNRTD